MKRRKFILLSGLGLSAIAAPTWYYTSNTTSYDQLLIEPELLSHIWDGATIGKMGGAYRTQFPDENTAKQLGSFLSQYASTESTTTIESLRRQISEDFRQENTVMIDGWILSRTEARQCGLFSLTQTN